MAEIIRSADPAMLERCLARFRQGAGLGGASTPTRDRHDMDVIFAVAQELVASVDASNLPALDLGKAPSMALFSAMREGPEAFESACSLADPSLIDMPFSEAVQVATGVDLRAVAAVRRSRGSPLHHTPLQWANVDDQWVIARSLLARGANPNLFNAEVTPIGMAAYVGAARCLCEMISFGANATLYLPPEHAPATPSVHGSTLLHRVANRAIGPNKKAIILILAEDEKSYPSVLPLTIQGLSPLDWADGDSVAVEGLLEAIAGREAKQLDLATSEQGTAAGNRLRV